MSQELKEAKQKIDKLTSDISSLEDEKKNLAKELNETNDEIVNLKNDISSKETLSKDLEDANKEIDELKAEITSKKDTISKLENERDNFKDSYEKENEKVKKLESDVDFFKNDKVKAEKEVEKLNNDLKESKTEIDSLKELITTKDKKIESLENKSQKERENTLTEKEEIENKLQDFIEKIENPYKDLLKAIKVNSDVEAIEKYLGFKNDRELSKSMIIFSLINEDALARKIAMFYSERKKIMKDDDFKIIEEVNKIYQEQKPWGILYAEPKGDYSSSLMRDRKSSDIYKTFTAMYSPAYRKDENGNSPLRGIVDGKK